MKRENPDAATVATASALSASQAGKPCPIRLDAPFQDNMVLQHGKTIPVRGWAEPNALVEVSIGDVHGQSIAANDGCFTVRLPELKPAEGLSLHVKCGENVASLKNIAAGNVYLIAGQSNIVFELDKSRPGLKEMTPADFRGLHYFKIPVRTYYGKQRTLPGTWQTMSKENSADTSGIGFFFGRAVYQATGIPVGLIDASLGGINIESWISRETLLDNPAYREEMLQYDRIASGESAAENGKMPSGNTKLLAGIMKLFPSEPDDSNVSEGFEKTDFDDSGWDTMRLPDSWTQAGHNHAGIFWYRRSVELPESMANCELEIHLGAIDKADKVFFNGVLIGSTGDSRKFDAWNQLRVYRIPGKLVHAGKNQLAIRAASMVSICTDGGLIGPGEEMYIKTASGEAERIHLCGDWRFRETFDAGTIGMTFMRTLGPGFGSSFHMMFDNMIAPLDSFPLCGVLWYQGEANAICTAQNYRTLLNSMISEWRHNTGDSQLDFFIVQLPDYGNPHLFAPYSQWALIREAQQQAARDSGAACIVTLGFGDILDLHPTNKLGAGEAVAQAAIARLQGKEMPSGPQLTSMKSDGKCLLLKFEKSALPETGSLIHGFSVAGRDGKVFPARAEVINSTTLAVSSPHTDEPESVWYAWADNPVPADFRGANGIAASPFRAALNQKTGTAFGWNVVHVE